MSLATLVQMLAYCRPAFSETEEAFIEKYLAPLGVQRDGFGNLIKVIGDDPRVLWSSHTDTVHINAGFQRVVVDGNVARLADGSKSNCLGADCTTGVWLMTEMIKAGKPGLYVFHREEERGGGGSSHIAHKTPELLEGIDFAIAFDRYGTESIITHQFGQRCSSDDFARSVIDQMPGFKPDDGGSFTDTANYMDIVPECSNFSVGYLNHHTYRETQNLSFAEYLLDKILNLDTSLLSVSRDPSVVYVREATTRSYYPRMVNFDSTCKLIRNNPEAVAGLLEMYGVTHTDLVEHIFDHSGALPWAAFQ